MRRLFNILAAITGSAVRSDVNASADDKQHIRNKIPKPPVKGRFGMGLVG